MTNEQEDRRNPTDAALLAHLDEEQVLSRAEEMEQAPRHRLQQLAREEATLRAALYRATCPDSLTLGEYLLKTLSSQRKHSIAEHLEQCPHCRNELVIIDDFLQATAADIDFGILERARILVARLIPQFEAGETAPQGLAAFASVRGREEGPLLYEAEDVQISLEIEDDPRKPGRRTVLGLVLGAGAAGWRAELRQGDLPLEISRVDELGNFVLAEISPATYDLILRGPNVEIHLKELQL